MSRKLKIKIRFIAVILSVFICLSFSMPVFASLGGYEIQDLYLSITNHIRETNELLKKAFDFSQTSPYDVINSISGTAQGNIAVNNVSSTEKISQ